ncbi:hypothetical protein EVAR_2435_1 [Eumeta japonica]|uniref:Uncharacterized protein n=1 Tax=Eumeta variegata TaxID=151549 RepID=A0A4C1SQV0_EUMVA|nr:hypothetical protein EVAR_2435_1 [Eumeta japonica]
MNITRLYFRKSPSNSRSGSPSLPVVSSKRSISARSSDTSTGQSDGTVRGSDSEQQDPFTIVVSRRRNRTSQRRCAGGSPSMDDDIQPAAPTSFIDPPTSPDIP